MRINSSIVSGYKDTGFGSISKESKYQNTKTAASAEDNLTMKDFKKAVGTEDFEHIIDGLRDMTKDLKSTRMEFRIHDDTKRVMVKIYNKANDELIYEVPPEKFLDLIAGLWKQAGLIVDARV